MTEPVDLQPTLAGPTIELRPTVPEDWDALYAAASDPSIWALHPAHDRWREQVFRGYFDDALRSRGGLTIRERATKRVIGASRYSAERAAPGEIEIGWTFLTRDHWGGGTNAELKRLMLDHAFRWFDPVIFLVGEGNVRSRRALEKIGAVLREGDVREQSMAGKLSRHVVYELGRPQ